MEIAELLQQHARWLVIQRKPINYETAMVKLVITELAKRLTNIGTQILGLYGQLWEGSQHVPVGGRIQWYYLSSFIQTIGAGTSEICRNIMAVRGLGLLRA